MLLKRAVFTNSLAGLCLTKLDVLDGAAGDQDLRRLPFGRQGSWTRRRCSIDRFGECEPVYEIDARVERRRRRARRRYDALPKEAKDYLRRIEELAGVPIDIISTGPSRDAIIMRRHPFD